MSSWMPENPAATLADSGPVRLSSDPQGCRCRLLPVSPVSSSAEVTAHGITEMALVGDRGFPHLRSSLAVPAAGLARRRIDAMVAGTMPSRHSPARVGIRRRWIDAPICADQRRGSPAERPPEVSGDWRAHMLSLIYMWRAINGEGCQGRLMVKSKWRRLPGPVHLHQVWFPRPRTVLPNCPRRGPASRPCWFQWAPSLKMWI